ncbi:MAG: phosphate ABC transporter permease PstA [Chitinophagaceae bacterium]|jgi:phosphate transport system permease protein|nr:MAG: phosphate ABC transporter permease PstA [Chitinophagaceae bacterium]
MSPKNIQYRKAKSTAFKSIVILLSFLCTIPLIGILYYIVRKGIKAINWQFLVQLPKPVGETGGGIANALTGSIALVLVAAVIAIPVGILAGIYLSENKDRKLAYWTRLSADILQGVPSIVTGIVAYFWIVKPMKGFSSFSGSIALAVMMLPIVVRTTEETLLLIPHSLKEAALALGVPYHRTILKVIVPCGLSGILSGVLLSVARIAGETAPLLFTAFGNPYMNLNIFKPMQSLPLMIYNYAISPYDQWHNMAWGAAMILLIWILSLNILTKLITKRWRVQL